MGEGASRWKGWRQSEMVDGGGKYGTEDWGRMENLER